MSRTVTCPYCNAFVPVTAAAVPGQRLPCPRCGEQFRYQPPDEDVPGPVHAETAPLPGAELPAPPRTTAAGWSNRAVAGLVLAVMGGMAVLGLTFAQLTTPLRRQLDTARPEVAEVLQVPAIARLGRLLYVGLLGAYLVGFLVRRGQTASLPARVAARTLVVLLGLLMLADVLALSGISLSLSPWRRVDPVPSLTPAPAAVEPVPPSELTALRYLPADTSVLIGLHLAEIWRDPLARAYLQRLRLGPGNLSIAALERWTGLPLEQIDHAVVGLKLENLPPRLTLVVRSRQPYQEETVRQALQAERRTERGQRTLYRFPVEQLEGVVWFADARTLVIGLTTGDFDEVPRTPHPDSAHLAEPLLLLLRERLGQGSQFWAAAHVEDWQKTLAALLLANLTRETRERLAPVRTAGLWLQLADGVTFNAALQCRTDKDAEELDRYLERLAAEGNNFPLLVPQAQGEFIAQELARNQVRTRNGPWVNLQTRASAAAVRQALQAEPQQ